jgi:hypothetical protein
MALIIEMALRRRPMSEAEVCRWAEATAGRNGTRTAAAPDMRSWYTYAKGRIEREFGIKIEEVATQQLSKARAGVLLSGVRSWQATVGELLDDKPELAREGLRAHGNSDEMKLDLYEVLQRKGVVPVCCEAQWEVEGERCPQITFLGGFQGYLTKERANELGRRTSLPEVRELFWRARAQESGRRSAFRPGDAAQQHRPGGRLPKARTRLLGLRGLLRPAWASHLQRRRLGA